MMMASILEEEAQIGVILAWEDKVKTFFPDCNNRFGPAAKYT